MKLADALRGMSERALQPYRSAAGATPAAGTAELVAQLTAPERVVQVIAALPPAPLLALRILWFHAAPRMQPWLFHTVFTRSSGGGGADRAIEALVTLGLLVPPLSAAGQYAIPDEVRPALLQVVADEWLPASGFYVPLGAEPSSPTAADPAAVVADFVRFLGSLRSGVRVRQQDPIPYQSDQRRLVTACDPATLPALPPEHPDRTTWEGYDPIIGPLFSAAVSYGLIETRDGAWRESARAAAWAHLPPAVQWRGLLQVWAGLCGAPHEAPLARGVFGCIGARAWCRPLSLARWLGQFTASGEERLVGAVQNLTLRLGVRLGALEWGLTAAGDPLLPDDAGRVAVRLRPEAAAALGDAPVDARFPGFEETPLVQGTFDVLAGPRTPTSTVWVLESWAERAALDRFTTYRLTRRSVGAAARRGEAVGELLEVLARSPGGVPQNVAFTVCDWAAGTIRLSADLAVVLRCADAATAERAAATTALRTCERLGPTSWLVPTDDLGSVWRALQETGCDVVGDLQELRDRLRGRLDRPLRMGPPAPVLPWPGAMDLPLPVAANPSPEPAPVEAAAGDGGTARPGDGTPTRAEGCATVPAAVPPAAAARESRPRNRRPQETRAPAAGTGTVAAPRRPRPRSLGDALPAVMRMTQREVRRTLERGLQAGWPVGLVDAAGTTHVVSVRELALDAVAGHCARCGTDHRLPLRDVTATFKP